jgi:hypothetical protein
MDRRNTLTGTTLLLLRFERRGELVRRALGLEARARVLPELPVCAHARHVGAGANGLPAGEERRGGAAQIITPVPDSAGGHAPEDARREAVLQGDGG